MSHEREKYRHCLNDCNQEVWDESEAREMLSGYLFILPFMLFLITFSLLPIIMTFIQSFQTGGTVGPRTFVGLQNYVKILTDRQYYDYLLNNFLYIIMSLPVGQFIAFGLALYLKKTSKLSPFFETVYFMPLLISMVAASMIMSYMFLSMGRLITFWRSLELMRRIG